MCSDTISKVPDSKVPGQFEVDGESLAKKIFSLEDSRAFALLSGDANPIHVDALAARRLLYGRSLVHGIHSLLWGLDQHVGAGKIKAVPASITATFSRPVFHGDAVTSSVTESKSPDEFRFSVLCRDADAAQVRLKAGTESAPADDGQWTPAPAIPLDDLTCVELFEDDMADKSGAFPLGLDVERLGKIFPALAATEWRGTVAMLLGLTRLVGMECPGRHSIFTSLKMKAGTEGAGPSLRYGVKRWDTRFQSLSLSVDAGRWSGTVGTIVRPSPVAQPSISEIKDSVKLGSLEGRHALIIGGSRGLGEVAAKILAAAGSKATITYHRGKTEAEAVLSDIAANGGEAGALAFDVTKPGEGDLASLAPVTDIYYFASPKIVANMTETFDSALFEHYMDFFVRPLPAVLALLQDHLDEEFSFYWPSTSFIDEPEPGFQEYVNAKTDGEACCQMLAGNAPKARFSMPRLPRMRTDQTQSILPLALADPVQILGASLLDHITPLVQRAV